MPRSRHELHGGVVDEHVLEGDIGEVRACSPPTTSRHSRDVSSTLALSTLDTRVRAAPKAMRAIRSISLARVDAGIAGRVRGRVFSPK